MEGAALSWTSWGRQDSMSQPAPSPSPLSPPLRPSAGTPRAPSAAGVHGQRESWTERARCQVPLTIVFLRLCWGCFLLAVLLLLLFLQDKGVVSALAPALGVRGEAQR